MVENNTTEENGFNSVEETLYRLNGTLMKEGDVGKALALLADRLEKMNWNLGTIAKNTGEIVLRLERLER